MSELQGKKVLIVGGTSGLGFAVAKALLSHSLESIIVASSTQAKVDSAIQRLKQISPDAKVTGETVDARDSKSVHKLLETVGEIDHLVWTSGDKFPVTYPDLDIDTAKGAISAFN